MNNIKSKIGRNLSNVRGWKTNRKIIVFESDNWRATRIYYRQAFKVFTK
jgi:hypothetical protein